MGHISGYQAALTTGVSPKSSTLHNIGDTLSSASTIASGGAALAAASSIVVGPSALAVAGGLNTISAVTGGAAAGAYILDAALGGDSWSKAGSAVGSAMLDHLLIKDVVRVTNVGKYGSRFASAKTGRFLKGNTGTVTDATKPYIYRLGLSLGF